MIIVFVPCSSTPLHDDRTIMVTFSPVQLAASPTRVVNAYAHFQPQSRDNNTLTKSNHLVFFCLFTLHPYIRHPELLHSIAHHLITPSPQCSLRCRSIYVVVVTSRIVYSIRDYRLSSGRSSFMYVGICQPATRQVFVCVFVCTIPNDERSEHFDSICEYVHGLERPQILVQIRHTHVRILCVMCVRKVAATETLCSTRKWKRCRMFAGLRFE